MVKKRIALITTWFPPQQSVATNRMLSFVEYLSDDFEIEVFCLSQTNESIDWNQDVKVHYSSSSNMFEGLKDLQSDGPLLHKFKVGARIILSKFFKNPLKKWQLASLKKLLKNHSEKRFDVIISSYSPQEAHLVAIDFCKKYPEIPWIADMRDEMSVNPYLNQTTKLNLEKIEKEVDKYASALLTVSEPIMNDFKINCPSIPHFLEVRNGFNHDFKRELTQDKQTTIFKIGYFGTFYGPIKPSYLFQSLIELQLENEGFNFEFHIVGSHKNFNIPNELKKSIIFHDQLPYLDAIDLMAKMDANVLVHPVDKRKGVYSGKLFDYISVQKPVLAMVDKNDVAAQLINEFNCGYVADFSSVNEIKSILREAQLSWMKHIIKYASADQVESLHRKKQIGKLKVLIEKLLTNQGKTKAV